MDWKKIGKAVLFPPMFWLLLLLPVSIGIMIYGMFHFGENHPITIATYVVAFYTLTIWCFRVPYFIQACKVFKRENRYARLWLEDTHLRVNVSLYGSFLWNTAYSVFQLGLGIWHHTFWFYSLAGYYIALAVMRFSLVRHTRKNKPGENMVQELIQYRSCGIVFLMMNLALSMMIFFMVYWNRTFNHHEITTIAMATYTFTSLIMAIVNVIKYRKFESPVYSASKAINLAAACVSMLTLESTMLTTFGKENLNLTFRRRILGATGGMISIFIIVMAIYMIVRSSKKLKELKMLEDMSNG